MSECVTQRGVYSVHTNNHNQINIIPGMDQICERQKNYTPYNIKARETETRNELGTANSVEQSGNIPITRRGGHKTQIKTSHKSIQTVHDRNSKQSTEVALFALRATGNAEKGKW